jgi:6-phosphogluconolactonase
MNRIVLSLCLTLLANDVAMTQGSAPALSTKVARYVFVVNSGGLAQVSSVDGASGLIRPTGMINLGASAFGVATHPNGQFIYFAAGNEVLAYSVTSTGTLKAIQGSPFLTPGASSLWPITVSPSGKFLIAADYNLGGIWSFAVNATTGALTLAPGDPFPTGNTPFNLTFDRASKFAYVSCEGTGISGYSINQTNGSLTTVHGSPFALSKHNSVAAGITVDGSGKYVYVEG